MSYTEGHCLACGAALTQTRCDQCGAATGAGGYRVKSLLAQTPHSRMYVAEDPVGRQVALKELIFAAVPSTKQVEAFEREGALLQELEHPRIPKFLSSFRDGEGARTRLYLAQELVEGESLWQRLRAGTFGEAQARDVAAQMLDVLVYLHGRTPRVIHRDVKPHNLILRPDGNVALVDFGAARELLEGVTHQSTLVGTYGYMPPDQLAGSVDPTCDLYALGATLMHLLTGRPPEHLIGDDLELGAKVLLHCAPEFERYVHKLAAKTVAKRFPTAEAAAQALQALPPVRARGGKRVPRMAVAAGAALVIAATGVVWKTTRAPAGTKPPVPVAAPASAPPPAPAPVLPPAAEGPVKVWAWTPKIQVYKEASDLLPLVGQTIPVGTELLVDRPPGSGAPYLKLQPPHVGYVRAVDVIAPAPQYEGSIENARNALKVIRLDDAESWAELARQLRPTEREPLALLHALYDAEKRPHDARWIHDLLKEMGPAPVPPPGKTDERFGPKPRSGEKWFVGTTMLRIRQKPSSDSRILAELGINAEVDVLGLQDEWAEVSWTPPGAVQDFDLERGGIAEGAKVELVRGFVAQAYLVREKVDKDWTVARAQEAHSVGDSAEHVRLLSRAMQIDPVDRDNLLSLASAAVETRDYLLAAGAAVASQALLESVPEPLVEMKLAYRCRGDRNRAEWIDDQGSGDYFPENACVGSLTPKTCGPCGCLGSRYAEESETNLKLVCMVEERRKKVWPSHEAMHEHCRHQVEEQFEKLSSELDDRCEESDSAERKRTDMLEKIDKAFPAGPWMRVKVQGPERLSPERNRIVVYAFSVDEHDVVSEESTPEGREQWVCQADVVLEAIDAGAVPPPGKEVTLWVRAPAYEGSAYGVAFSKSAAAVADELKQGHSSCGSGLPGSVIIEVPKPINCYEKLECWK
jgi:serine/threonine protein kinase